MYINARRDLLPKEKTLIPGSIHPWYWVLRSCVQSTSDLVVFGLYDLGVIRALIYRKYPKTSLHSPSKYTIQPLKWSPPASPSQLAPSLSSGSVSLAFYFTPSATTRAFKLIFYFPTSVCSIRGSSAYLWWQNLNWIFKSVVLAVHQMVPWALVLQLWITCIHCKDLATLQIFTSYALTSRHFHFSF